MNTLNEELNRYKELMGVITEREITFTQILDDTKKEKGDGIHRIERSQDITDVTNHYDGKESSSDYPTIPGDDTIKFVYVQGSTKNEVISDVRIFRTIKKTTPDGESSYNHEVAFDLDRSKGKNSGLSETIGVHIEITGLESGSHKVIMPLENYWVSFTKE